MPSLSALLGTGSTSRPKLTPAPSSSSSVRSTAASVRDGNPEYIFDPEQLPAVADPPPDLRELNGSLGALAAVFPDVQVDVFREILANFDGESRLAVAADALLKNRAAWVKGRWKVPGKDGDEGTGSGAFQDGQAPVPEADVFRSADYKRAVKSLAWHEFKGLSRSAINAVLAEQNYSYLQARQTLVHLSSKSWRYTISSLFLRRKPVTSGEAENHPLVVWKSSGQGSILPSFRATGNAELDRELFAQLIAPLREQARAKQEGEDRTLAVHLNTQEAEAAEATYECECCFATAAFEEITTCNGDDDGHMVCFRCVRHTVTEAVFGQGWHRSIDKERGALRCPAMGSAECDGCIPLDHLQRAMLDEKKGTEILLQLEQRLAEHNLLACNLPLVRCPFCSYAEVDELYVPAEQSQLRLRLDSILFLLLVGLVLVPFLVPLVLFSTFVAIVLSARPPVTRFLGGPFAAALTRLRRRRHGLRFVCRAPACRRASCLACAKAWVDVHVCRENELVALRTHVELAMSMAVKRVCPRCATSFVKNAGCNKLTCPCGYRMCYVCRRDIAAEGYRHFCEHFRPEGDGRRCTQCDRCNLWEGEDTDAVLRAAREEAERRWKEREQRDLSVAERTFLDTGLGNQGGSFGSGLARPRLPTAPEIFDFLVDRLFVC